MSNGTTGFWEKWQTVILLGGMVVGFLSSGYLYAVNEGRKEQKIDYMVAQIAEFAASRYTKDDAAKDQALEQSHYLDVSDRLKALEWRANRTEQAASYTRGVRPPIVQPSPMPKLVP